jgi:hypothetical protein
VHTLISIELSGACVGHGGLGAAAAFGLLVGQSISMLNDHDEREKSEIMNGERVRGRGQGIICQRAMHSRGSDCHCDHSGSLEHLCCKRGVSDDDSHPIGERRCTILTRSGIRSGDEFFYLHNREPGNRNRTTQIQSKEDLRKTYERKGENTQIKANILQGEPQRSWPVRSKSIPEGRHPINQINHGRREKQPPYLFPE